MDFYKIPADRVVVVYDDVDLPLGKIRLRQGGGSGGHNGVKSLQQHVGDDFLRIRIGVGQPDWFADGKFDKGYAEAGDYVLAAFAAHEREPLMAACDRAESALDCLLTQDLTAAMNAYNG
jgi:PTH1 family peptidyl-tRNA hydrolase